MTPPRAAPRWYTFQQLGERWGVSADTVRHWFMEARREGAGPQRGQARLQRGANAFRRFMILRADYAIALRAHVARRRLEKLERGLERGTLDKDRKP